jgi:O-antigen ligase
MPIRWALAVVAVIALARPRDGLLVLAGLVPFGQIAARYFGTEMRGAEALVLAGLAGVIVRAWWSGRVRRFPSGPIESAALLFGLIVAASAVEQVWFLQVQRNFPAEFLLDLGSYVGHEYLWAFRGFGSIANAMLLLEGLALLVWAIECGRGDAVFRERLLRILVVSAAGAALLNPLYAIEELLGRSVPSRGVLDFLMLRWTVHVGDVNAAGSYFSLMIFLAGGLVALRGRRGGGGLLLLALIAIGGVWVTGSRAAFAAVLLVLIGIAGWIVVQRTMRPLRVLAGTLLLSLPLWYAVAYRLSFRSSGERAFAIRLEMLRSGMAMISAHPVLGVGIGQYALWSRHYTTAALRQLYRLRENAHNNFVQIAGETGLVGFGSFIWVLVAALREAFRASRTDLVARASVLGLAAFLITWLSGHPLLVPAVAYPFWIVLGMAASAGLGPRPDDRAEGSAPVSGGTMPASVPLALAAVLLLVSLPIRLEGWKATVRWDRVSYGLHAWERGPSGERFRWAGPRARIHVRADAVRVTLPLRGNTVSPENPLLVRIVVDGRLADDVRIESQAWRSVRVALAPSATHHTIDILPSRSWVPAEVFEGNTDTRRLGVQLGEPSIELAPVAP